MGYKGKIIRHKPWFWGVHTLVQMHCLYLSVQNVITYLYFKRASFLICMKSSFSDYSDRNQNYDKLLRNPPES
jgi:hypothetical protein